MKELPGSIKLILIFLALAGLIVLIFLLTPESIRLSYPREIFPK